MMFYEIFYRKFGIRRVGQLMSPPLPDMKNLEMPRQSILHYVGGSAIESGPAPDEFLFRNVTRTIPVTHVTEIGDDKGNPRRIALAIDLAIRKYHIKNRRYKHARTMEQALRDVNVPLVINYAFLHRMYRYVRSLYTEYNKWWNINSAVWKNIAKIAEESDRNQFIVYNLPKLLPGLTSLKTAALGVTQRTVKDFHTAESLVLLELWKWCGEERETSLFNLVPLNRLNRVNLIFQESGKWFTVNLGVINDWRMATEAERLANPEAPSKGLNAQQFQRRMLRGIMALFQVRTDAAPELSFGRRAEDVLAPQVEEPKDQTVIRQDPTMPIVDPDTGAMTIPAFDEPMPEEAIPVIDDDDGEAQFVGKAVLTEEEIEKQLDADLEDLDRLSKAQAADQDEKESHELNIPDMVTPESGVMKVCARLADDGLLTGAEYRKYEELARSHRKLIAPDGKSTLYEFTQVPKEALAIEKSAEIPDIKHVFDKSMLKSSLLEFDTRYIKHVMARDISAMVLNIQNAGICITDYNVERVEDAVSSYDTHTVRVNPVEGAPSTLRFKLPALADDGTYRSNGVKYRMRKQRSDLPIRKIAPNRVALTSYYGKVFISRSEKRVNDYSTWLNNAVMAKGLDMSDSAVTNLKPNNVFDNTFKCPKLYSSLAMSFRSFTVAGFEWNLDHTARLAMFGQDALTVYEKDGAIIIGKNPKGELLIVDQNNTLYTGVNGVINEFSTMETLLDLPVDRAPVDFVEIKVMGKTIPLGVMLGYEVGLEKLMRMLRVEPRRVPAGTRLNLEPHEYPIVFSDETLVFSRDDRSASLILAGFSEFHKTLRNYSVFEFDRRGVYLNLLEGMGSSARYLREIDLLYQLFIDPITRDLLIEMGEPTDFRGLLMRATELLLTDYHPKEGDGAYLRTRGYERMAGAVYSEIVRAIRVHNGRGGKTKHPIDLNPYAVWKNISQDPSVLVVLDINPIENLKQLEAVTYSGVGGRNSRSMTKGTREYDVNDMGTISEATVDSSDVAINTFTSADPQFTSLRGISRRYKLGESGMTPLLSTSALNAPCATNDDPKRVNFISIHHSHGISCDGYRQMAVRTGYEQVIPHRTGDLFALTAKQNGRVLSVSPTGIIVEYQNGETKGYEIGRRFGDAAGLVIPHTIVTALKEGQEFKNGDLLTYNSGFFELDILNPANAVWKAGITVKTVLLESTLTLEDSSVISSHVAKLLTTQMTKVRIIVVNFDQVIHRLVKQGQFVEAEDILCVIEDAVTAQSGQFDEDTLDTLRILSAQTPQAKSKGVVERIEVFYHGDKEDMSDSLRQIANVADRDFAKRNKSAGKPVYTGSVDDGYRTEGDPLTLDTMAIRIYITTDVSAGVGDKGEFGSQMKTVFGATMEDPILSESGVEIHAVFGAKSVADRIVLSPELIGTTTTLLKAIGKRAVAIYKK